MVFLDNLVALMNAVIDQRAEGIFIGGDKSPLSTSKLLEWIQIKMKGKASLFKLPDWIVSLMHRLKPQLVKRLFFSLTVDTKQTNQALQFTPPFSSEQGIEQMVKWFEEIKTDKLPN